VPYLEQHLGQREVMVVRILRTVAVGESFVDQAIADLETSSNPTVGLSAHPGQTDVRIAAKAPTRAEAEALVADFEINIRQRLGDAIYATGDATLEAVLADLLQQRQATLAVAETITKGDITQRLSDYPNALRGGVVAADGESLARYLCLKGIATEEEAGVGALAEGLRDAWGTSYGLVVLDSEQGGPWVAIASDAGVDIHRLRFRGHDRRARYWTTTRALEFLRRLLLGLAASWGQPATRRS